MSCVNDIVERHLSHDTADRGQGSSRGATRRIRLALCNREAYAFLYKPLRSLGPESDIERTSQNPDHLVQRMQTFVRHRARAADCAGPYFQQCITVQHQQTERYRER